MHEKKKKGWATAHFRLWVATELVLNLCHDTVLRLGAQRQRLGRVHNTALRTRQEALGVCDRLVHTAEVFCRNRDFSIMKGFRQAESPCVAIYFGRPVSGHKIFCHDGS